MNRLIAAFVLYLVMAKVAMAQLTVNCQGSGKTVFLIGGGPAFTTWNLEPIQQRLRTRFKVCRWDMRGVGENAELPVNEGIPVLKQWLDDMAAVLPDEPIVLWGHSWGALQSLLFARHYPERVRALILNNPVDAELSSLENIESKRYVHPHVEQHLDIEDIDTPAEQRHHFRSKIASYFLDAENGWEYSAQFDQGDTNNRLNVQIWQEYRQMALSRADLKRLSSKVYGLIYCRQDVLMPESFDEYSKVFSSEKHHIIDGCAHFPWEETPAEFYDTLLRTLLHTQ